MNVRAAFRSFVDNLRGRFIKRSQFDAQQVPINAIGQERIVQALSQLSRTGYHDQIAAIYDSMLKTDTHISGVRMQLRAGIAGIEMEPVATSDEPDAEMIAEACATAMERPGASWSALVAGILEGYFRGASLTEVTWEDPPVQVPGKKALRYWRGFSLVPQRRLIYDYGCGDLKLITEPSKPSQAVPFNKLPPGKFVRCQVDEDIPDFALRGLYRSILSDWFARLNVGKWEQMAIERYGMPIPVGKYATDAGRLALEAAMAKFGAAGMLIFDDQSGVEWGPNTTKDLIHETFLEKSAERISIAFLGATQTVSIAADAGSKASAGEHQGIRRDILFALADLIAEIVRRDLFIPFVRENFGEAYVKYTPILRPQFDEPLDLKTTAEAWAVLQPMLSIPEGYAREVTGIPAPIVGVDGKPEPVLGAPPKPAAPFGQPAALAPPIPFPAPRAVSAARERVKVPIPDTPLAFGKDITTPLASIVKSSRTVEEVKRRIEEAPAPGFNKSADLLAAEMLDATMKGMLDARANRGAA